jgi:hypothetical protein
VPNPLAVLGVDTRAAEPPALSAQGELAVACWNFCDGWAPERWPVFGALHDVADWHALAELMQAIRQAMKTQADHVKD